MEVGLIAALVLVTVVLLFAVYHISSGGEIQNFREGARGGRGGRGGRRWRRRRGRGRRRRRHRRPKNLYTYNLYGGGWYPYAYYDDWYAYPYYDDYGAWYRMQLDYPYCCPNCPAPYLDCRSVSTDYEFMNSAKK